MIRAGRIAALAAAAALALAGTGAQAACWPDTVIAAARLHEFQLRLNLAELRCGAGDPSFAPSIAGMTARFAPQLQAAEAQVRAAVAQLQPGERRAYENYGAALGNRYGTDSTAPAYCTAVGDMLRQLGTGSGTLDDLHTYALLLVREPLLETRCPAGAGGAAATLAQAQP